MKQKMKKYYKIDENGKMRFSDRYDEQLGYIGETANLIFAQGVSDEDMLRMSEMCRRPGPLRGQYVQIDGEIVAGDPRLHSLDYRGVYAILPGESRMIQGDGIRLFSANHSRPPFLKRIAQAIKAIFVRPKLSAAALEPAEAIKCFRCGLEKEEQHQCKLTQKLLDTMHAEALASLPAKGERIPPCRGCWRCTPTK